MKSVSILHRCTSVFLAEQLKEKAGILISDGKADIICGKCGAPYQFCRLREPVCLDQLIVSGSGMLAYVGREIVWVHIKKLSCRRKGTVRKVCFDISEYGINLIHRGVI